MCEIDVDGYCEVWDNEWRRARKEHRCSSCVSIIEPGETYLRHFNVYDGNTTTEKACAVCGALWESFCEAHLAARSPSMLSEMLHSCIDWSRKSPDDRQWRWYLAVVKMREYRARQREDKLDGAGYAERVA